ncbi:MAG: UDP-glucuronate 4-epimerase [Bradymonadia bacterium]|jgi:UDP-glucuronate 4-epimerase
MRVLVTGAAGFIGYNVAERLLARGDTVVGLDIVNDYYDVRLKEARLARLARHPGFEIHRLDLGEPEVVQAALRETRFERAVHLAAQAGVRYSLTNPFAYVRSNLLGHVTVLELCRHMPGFEHLVYASSSSVYGGNTKMPFAVSDRVDKPISLYAATKKADELMSHTYSHLYDMPTTGLRFFTVYGPWGRPDMAMWLFTEAILAGRPIRVFNHGKMQRDFTFIDDIVSGVVAALDHPPTGQSSDGTSGPPAKIYNIGNNRTEQLMHMIGLLEGALGRKAEMIMEPMQPGDVAATSADISAIQADLGYAPTTTIEQGIPAFIDWYTDYHGL